MAATCLPLYANSTTASIKTKKPTTKPTTIFTTPPTFRCFNFTCKASNSSRCSPIPDYDLYDLLGIESSSNQSQIKYAYRALQKHCHPDIAGPAGHDMAIILNEAYSVLSDPSSRFAYDKEHSKMGELSGYTGKPLYSVWVGAESEERAVFVDEVKCVGCLKCALFAEKTFAIESVYGRARVVAQWADPEHKIQAAIDTCPVDCISVVERSDLAALEFLMSKQPRGNVRVGGGNSVGARVSNVFVDIKKFQTRVANAKDKASTKNPTETDQQRTMRLSAIQAIQAISNWLYWKPLNATADQKLVRSYHMSHQKNPAGELVNKLREAAAARKHPLKSIQNNYLQHDEYWVPLSLPPAADIRISSSQASIKPKQRMPRNEQVVSSNVKRRKEDNFIERAVPMGVAAVAAILVRLQAGDGVVGDVKQHAYGSSVLAVVNSSWLQVALAGITWYLIACFMVGLIEAVRNRGEKMQR